MNNTAKSQLRAKSREELLAIKYDYEQALTLTGNDALNEKDAAEAREAVEFINGLLTAPEKGKAGETEMEKLRRENAELAAENATLKKTAEIEPRIREKMKAGLSRAQAENVVKQQEEHDAWLAKTEKEQADAKAKAAKK